jgi:L-lactate dehydrogenase (cytochrome)
MPHFENAYATRGVAILSKTVARDFAERGHLDWTNFDLVRRMWRGKLVIKGILDKEDARIARESGVDAIIVSNHGGRQLDGVPASLRALPEVLEAANGRIEVLMDGGIRRGGDVVKAICLGAKAVLVGRAYAWALGAAGGPGVARAIEILRTDVVRTMRLLGCPSIRELGPSYIETTTAARVASLTD